MTEKSELFSHLLLIYAPQFCSFAPENKNKMVTELLTVWIIGVVAFFVLWAILAKVIQRISKKKQQEDDIPVANADAIEPKTEQHI